MGSVAAKKKRRTTGQLSSGHAGSLTSPTAGAWPARIVRVATLVGGFGTAVTFLPVPSLNPFGPPKFLVLMLSAALVLVGLALDKRAIQRVWSLVMRSHMAWVAAGLLGVAALATTTALSPSQAFFGGFPDYRGLVSIAAYAVIGLGALAVWSEPRGATTVARAAVIAAGVVAGVALLQIAGVLPGGPMSGRWLWRAASTLGNSSNLGLFEVGVLPLILFAAKLDEGRRWRVAATVVASASTVLLLLSMSRGGWLAALVVAAAVAVAFTLRGASARRLSVPVAVTALFIVAIVLLTPQLRSRAATLLDTGSRTAQWRLSAWKSTVTMSAERPFLGYGPDNFRYAYPPFQAAGQIDGRYGYQIVEAAHNLVLDTAAAFGVVGVLLLAALAFFAARNVVGAVASADPLRRATGTAVGASLLGIVTALQFHYVTMDAGALSALVLAGGAALPLGAAEAEPVEVRRFVRPYLAAASALFTALSVVAAAALTASALADSGVAAAQSGAPWAAARRPLKTASSLAAWDPNITHNVGTAATAILAKRFDADAARDGLAALDAAVTARPFDVILASERANLLLSAGLAARDRDMLLRSAAAFEAVEKRDPNTGIASVGRASALLAAGDVKASLPLFERGVRLSPRYRLGWKNLSRAYELAGKKASARRAASRAK